QPEPARAAASGRSRLGHWQESAHPKGGKLWRQARSFAGSVDLPREVLRSQRRRNGEPGLVGWARLRIVAMGHATAGAPRWKWWAVASAVRPACPDWFARFLRDETFRPESAPQPKKSTAGM